MIYYGGQGTPIDGTTLATTAYQGDVYQDLQTGLVYINRGSLESPVWSPLITPDLSNVATVPNIKTTGKNTTAPSTNQVLTAASSINPNAALVQISAAADISLTSTPQISVMGAAAGQQVLVKVTGTHSVTLTDNGTLAGSKIKLRTGTTLALAAGLVYGFIYDGTNWINLF
jgi:cytoskeletal protein RodZ